MGSGLSATRLRVDGDDEHRHLGVGGDDDKEAPDQAWIEQLLTERWGEYTVLLRGDLLDAAAPPALVAGDRLGLATYTMSGNAAELVTLDAVHPSRGIGTARVGALFPRQLSRRTGQSARGLALRGKADV